MASESRTTEVITQKKASDMTTQHCNPANTSESHITHVITQQKHLIWQHVKTKQRYYKQPHTHYNLAKHLKATSRCNQKKHQIHLAQTWPGHPDRIQAAFAQYDPGLLWRMGPNKRRKSDPVHMIQPDCGCTRAISITAITKALLNWIQHVYCVVSICVHTVMPMPIPFS